MAVVQRGIAAPRTVDGRQRIGFVAAVLDQTGDQLPDLLSAIARRHHYGVGGVDDDEVFGADRSDEPGLRSQVAIASLFGDDIAFDRVAVRVLGAHLPQGVPGANIAPAHADRYDRRTPRLLHHRIV